ncbi:pentatricopeptide repeat-containing protein [Tanacetum coccineum]
MMALHLGCRPVIALDGCFLKKPHVGEILTAIGRDGNNYIYPIAWVVVNVENKDNWSWFLELLGEDIDIPTGNGLHSFQINISVPGTYMKVSESSIVGCNSGNCFG